MKTKTILSCLLATFALATGAEVEKISPAEAAKRLATGNAVLVDVREPAEWKETGVAKPALLLAKSDFDGPRAEWKPFLEKNATKEIILYCRSGNRAGIVAADLATKGLKVSNAGGFKDWAAAGLPVREIDKEPAPEK
jgi:rhodanese-related sulfurtransferase